MSFGEAESISKYLNTKEIQLPSNNKWLVECINWYKAHPELRSIYNSLEEYACIQWLLSDLRDVRCYSLPTNCKEGTVQLTNKYCVQINWMRDISQSCYSQLQTLKNENTADSNDNVTTEETRKQNWEPNPKRVLMMEITDGCTTLKAMEYSPIPKLIEPFIPGCKVVLVGPIECRKGILLLKNNNINLLGGEVDHLNEVYSKEAMLSRCLNIIPPHNPGSERVPGGSVTSSSHVPASTSTDRSQQLFSDMDHLPASTSASETNPVEDNRDIVMSDDDDDIFYQLPDAMFNMTDNFGQQSNRSSPILNGQTIESDVQSSTLLNVHTKSPVLSSVPKSNKPKLFPSVEDLRPLGKEQSTPPNPKQSIPSSFADASFNAFESGVQSSTLLNVNTKSPILPSVPKSNKPKLFPVEDLRPLGKEQSPPSNPKQSIPSSFAKYIPTKSNTIEPSSKSSSTSTKTLDLCKSIEAVSKNKPSSEKQNSFFKSIRRNSPVAEQRLAEADIQFQMNYNEDLKRHNNSDEIGQLDVSNIDDNIYPQFKRVKVKVENVTKLKIRNGEWTCCASACIGDKTDNVTFCNKVLEKIFGISATEVEVWRGEMATNQSLKKKVNDILKAGQTKLKLLNCVMTVEYVSENCTPNIVSIHEL